VEKRRVDDVFLLLLPEDSERELKCIEGSTIRKGWLWTAKQ
jgi:hypothetical protein